MTLYMANSFHLARTTKLRLALRGRGRRRAPGRVLNFGVALGHLFVGRHGAKGWSLRLHFNFTRSRVTNLQMHSAAI